MCSIPHRYHRKPHHHPVSQKFLRSQCYLMLKTFYFILILVSGLTSLSPPIHRLHEWKSLITVLIAWDSVCVDKSGYHRLETPSRTSSFKPSREKTQIHTRHKWSHRSQLWPKDENHRNEMATRQHLLCVRHSGHLTWAPWLISLSGQAAEARTCHYSTSHRRIENMPA